jgi:hypothetical protein
MQIDRTIAKGQLVPVQFMQDALAATQTDVQLLVAEVASAANNAVDGIAMPFDGEIVAISYNTSAAATAGTLTIGPTKNGTEVTDPTLSVTTGTSGYDRAARGTATFVAGDRIGAEITTSGTWDGTTADLVVTVWVLLYLDGV